VPHQDSTPEGPVELAADEAWNAVVECCRRLRPTGVLIGSGHRSRARLLGPGEALPRCLTVLVEGRPPGARCLVLVALYGVVFLLCGRLCGRGRRRELRGVRLYTLDRRLLPRQPVRAGEASLLLGGRDGSKRLRVVDVSPGGVRVVPGDRRPPRRPFPAVLSLGGPSLGCLMEPTHAERGSGALGLRLAVTASGDDLVDFYLRRRFPALVSRAEVAFPLVRGLFASSGYLKLRPGCGQGLARWHRLGSPAERGRDMVYRAADGAVLGHISVTRAYARTWLMHQLATRRGHPESGRCREALYGFVAALPVLVQGERSALLGYFDRSRPWHQMTLERFTRWYEDHETAVIASFDRFEHDRYASRGAAPRLAGQRLEEATASDAAAAIALARAQLPGAVADALDLYPDRLITAALGGSGRTRSVLVLRAGRRPVAFAFCETGPRHGSLFNLFNMAQLFVGDDVAPSAQRALLWAVRAFYRAREIAVPVIVAPAGRLRPDVEPGTRLAETMGCVVIRGRGIRRWENFLRFQLGNLHAPGLRQPVLPVSHAA